VKEFETVNVVQGRSVKYQPFRVTLGERDGASHVVLSYSDSKKRTSIREEREMGSMLRGLIDSEFFDDIFLADADGKIVFQTARSGLRFSNLDALPITAR
jgi:hypothetical protein